MKQLSLEPYARKEHPVESHIAMEEVKPNLPALKERALDLVREYPGSTANELDAIDGTQNIHKVLVYLERDGLVKRCPSRKSRITGRLGATWEVI